MQQNEEKGKLFVGGLSWETTQASLLAYFSRYGEVVDCVVVMNPSTGKSRGFGFVTFKDPACVETVQAAGPHLLDGKQIDPNGCNRKKTAKGPKSAENSKKKLFVGGLPANIDDTQLREGFSKYGKVNEVVIVYDQQKQKPRGFGFLTFDSEESVDKVVRERFVLINGKQVECKRAEPRDVQMMAEQPTGLVMLTQGPDGTVGFMQAQPAAAGSALIYPSGTGLVTPNDLASAYRGMTPEVMQSSINGLRYIAQPGMPGMQNSQYVMLAPGGSTGAAGGGYLVQGGGSVGGMLMHGSNPAGHMQGLYMQGAGGQGGMMIPGGGGSFLMSGGAGAATGGYILSGAGGAGGYLVPGGATASLQPQYMVQYPSMMQQQPVCSLAGLGADFGAVYGSYGSSVNPYGGIQFPQGMYTFAKTEHNGTVSSMAVTDAASVLSDKASQAAAAAAASYPVINPYATLGLVGSSGETTEDGSLRQTVLTASAADGQQAASASANSAGQMAMQQKVGYYLVPGLQTQIPGYSSPYGSPLLAGVQGDAAQAALMAASPSLAAYSRLATNSTGLAQGYHPYRR